MLAIFRQHVRIQVVPDPNSSYPHYTPIPTHSDLAIVTKFTNVSPLLGIPIVSFMGSSQC